MSDFETVPVGTMEELKRVKDERDYLIHEYERAVGCGPQGFVHAAGHIYNAIVNARCDPESYGQRDSHLRSVAIRIYNSGYMTGHHDTVEGQFTDIHAVDMDSYHNDVVEELLAELVDDGATSLARLKAEERRDDHE